MTSLIIDADGRLTYMGEDGCRHQIFGDPELLVGLRQLQDQDSEECDYNSLQQVVSIDDSLDVTTSKP